MLLQVNSYEWLSAIPAPPVKHSVMAPHRSPAIPYLSPWVGFAGFKFFVH